MFYRLALALALAVVPAGCGRDDGTGRGVDGDDGADDVYATSEGLPPYREVTVPNPGAVVGVVEAEGDLPRDTVVVSASDQRVCGDRFLDRTIERTDDRLAHVIVWLEGIRAGKALPITRRFEVTNRRCLLEPRVQAVLAGGTLNVKSADPVLHRTLILEAGTRRMLETVRENDEGQVVPVESVLRRPRRLELRCDLHPWTRAWIQVFDHPYFAVTDRGGQFRIDGVPPGDYSLRAWHERLGALEQRVRVEAGREVRVGLEY